MKNFVVELATGAGLIVIIVLALFLVPFSVKLLWNWLMPELFGFKQITILQVLGLVLLFNLLTGIRFGK